MDERELSLAVVGINHPNEDRRKTNRRFEVGISTPGEPVTLRFEPKNPHDPQAIAVDSARGIQIGYIRAEQNAWIGSKIRSETYEVVFQEPRPNCAVIRIRFGGGAPTLPPPRPPRPEPPDETSQLSSADWDNFYPDEPGDFGPGDDSLDGVDPEGPEWGA